MSEPISEPNPAEPGAPAEPTEEPAPATEPTEEEAAEEEEQTPAEGEPEPQEGSGPVGAVSEREIEKMFKRVETANAGYSKRLGDIMGEEANVLEPCPRCSDPFLGFIFPPLMKPASAEVKAAVLVSVGEEPALATKPDPYA